MNNKKRPQNWTAEEKLKAIIAYGGKNEEERGQYLRSQGLYSVDIERWREEILESLSGIFNNNCPLRIRIAVRHC